jgi:hypothetical protein
MTESGWQSLSRTEAREHHEYGFRGWLIAFYVYALFLGGWHLSSLVGGGQGLMMMYETPDNVAKMQVILGIKVLLWLPFLVLTPIIHKLMPAATMICIGVMFLIESITVLFFLDLPLGKIISINIFNLLILVSYTAYLTRSRRVNLTYRLRVRAN